MRYIKEKIKISLLTVDRDWSGLVQRTVIKQNKMFFSFMRKNSNKCLKLFPSWD